MTVVPKVIRAETAQEKMKINKNFTSVLGKFENDMNAKVDKKLSKMSSPVGRLKSQVSEWEEIGPNNCIAQLIKVGYKIPFVTKELENLLLIELVIKRSVLFPKL